MTSTDDHKTVALAIGATLSAGLLVLVAIFVIQGGQLSTDLFERFVAPEIISALALTFFFMLLFIRNKSRQRKVRRKGKTAAVKS